MFDWLEKLRIAWAIILTTDSGNELSHLCRCIQIALRAQATVYPIFYNEVYEGSVICGAGFTISVGKECIQPLSYAELQSVVRKSSAHSLALKEIAKLAGGVENALDNCTTMRELATFCRGTAMDEITKATIVKEAYKLSFKNRYWSTAVTNIHKALVLITNPEQQISVDVPMHPKYLFSSERIELVLAAFGHQAPTFMIPNGAKCKLTAVDPPKHLYVRTTTVDAAVLDMRYMKENGLITNNNQALSSKHRDAALKNADKVEVWKLLKAVCSTALSEDTTTQAADVKVAIAEENAGDWLW
jgi:hypothetical protein